MANLFDGEGKIDAFLQIISESQLLDESQFQRLLEAVEDSEKTLTPTIILHKLKRARWLSQWQSDQLLQGDPFCFVLGQYKLLDFLGKGAMGNVYLAEHHYMHRRAAIKVVHEHLAGIQNIITNFFHESEAIAALDHPNIVRAYDFNHQSNVFYLVMEYVEGRTLREYHNQHKPLSMHMVANFIRQAAAGLAHAHSRDIIHRDIKPSNLIVDNNGHIKILDMGLALRARSTQSIDEKDETRGTPDFMSPEQALDCVNVDGRTDIYSLGGVLGFLLTGLPPNRGKNLVEIIHHILNNSAKSLRETDPNIPEGLDDIYLKMVARKPEDRFQSAIEVENVLSHWLKTTSPALLYEATPETLHGLKVLVADDDPLILQILKKLLENSGFRVILAEDGATAIKQLSQDIAVCLFDLDMPHVSGIECLQYVKKHYNNIPVIIISGMEQLQLVVQAMREGAFDYFTKPADYSNVMSRIFEAVNLRAHQLKLSQIEDTF